MANAQEIIAKAKAKATQVYYTSKDDTMQKIIEKYNVTQDELIRANETNVLFKKQKSPDYTVTSGAGWDFSTSGLTSITTLTVHYFSNVQSYVKYTYKGTVKSIDETNYKILKSLVTNNIVYDNTTNEYWEIIKNIETSTPFYDNPGHVSFIDNILTISFTKYENTSIPYTVADYLRESNPSDYLRQDILIYIPVKISGGIEEALTTESASVTTIRTATIPRDKLRSIVKEESDTGADSPFASLGCYFNIWERNTLVDTKYLPVYPNEFTDTNSGHFNPTTILGRSVAYQTYSDSSRSVNLSLEMHEELCDNYDYVPSVISALESICYPGYETGQVNPCEIELFIGRHLHIRGILGPVSTQWQKPMIDGRLVHATVNISITETTGPYSRHEIASSGAWRT